MNNLQTILTNPTNINIMKKGFLLSIDAMIAISVLLLLATFLAGISFTYSYPEAVSSGEGFDDGHGED